MIKAENLAMQNTPALSFALVGDTDGVDIFYGYIAIGQSLPHSKAGVAPDLLRVVFYPALFWEDLLVLWGRLWPMAI